MRSALIIWAIALLGVFAGGCITILFVLLPFWASLPPQELMHWFRDFGQVTGITMLPMEIIPLVLCLVIFFRGRNEENRTAWIMVNVFNILILLSFFVYFLPVNLSFVRHTIPESAVPSELERWKLVHSGRTILSVLSMVFAIAGRNRAH